MTGQEITAFIGAIGTFLVSVGVGVRWYLAHLSSESDKKLARQDLLRKEEADRQDAAREELHEEIERRFALQADQMAMMSRTIAEQGATIRRYEDMLDDYGTHVEELKAVMRQNSLPIPEFRIKLRKAHGI